MLNYKQLFNGERRNEMIEESILVVDDEARMRKLIKDFLSNKGYHIIEAEDGEKALEEYEKNENKIMLILLDVMMPKLDGWSVLRQIRQTNKEVPIIMLTARGEEQDELFGFELGVDEYISKPFSPNILIARIRSLLKRCDMFLENTVEFEDFSIDNRQRLIYYQGKRVITTPKEFDLLYYLVNNPNIALSREQILNAVWGMDYYGDTRTVDSHIKCLRAKLGAFGEKIKTVRKIGYKLEV